MEKQDLLAAADRVLEELHSMTDEALFAALAAFDPPDSYSSFMDALERGDHLDVELVPLADEVVTPVNEDGTPVS